jgi:hypothetical protein
MLNATTLIVALHAALLFPSSNAQTTSRAGNQPQNPAQQTAPVSQAPLASEQGETPHTAPVFWISSVEVMRSAHGPQLDVVRVRGLVTTEGWESAELIPLTKGIAADGILDLALIAEAPTDSTAPTTYPEIEAVFTIEPGHPFKGVRVHGAANRVVVESLPGYAEGVNPPKTCVECTGKYLVRKGEAVPTSRKPETIVREEELPLKLRVIRESDGIGSLDSDPNRLTLLLNEKSEIILAVWD